MKRIVTFQITLALILFATIIKAQRPNREVDIAPLTEGEITDIGAFITADIEAQGANYSPTVYILENGAHYFLGTDLNPGSAVSGFPADGNWSLYIEASSLTDLNNKPILTQPPGGAFQIRPRGSGNTVVSMTNIWYVLGEGPDEATTPYTGFSSNRIKLLNEADGSATLIFQDCILEKDGAAVVYPRRENNRVFIDNCIIRNFTGTRRKVSSNGSVINIDGGSRLDTISITNSVIHNIADRIVKQEEGDEMLHGYLKFDGNTVFNQLGRLGFFTLRNWEKVEVTNNLLINPSMLGTIIKDKGTESEAIVDGESNNLFDLQNTSDAELIFASNNIFWEQEVLDFYAANDSVYQKDIYSEELIEALGGAAAAEGTYITEPLKLDSVPPSLLPHVIAYYEDPNAASIPDIVVGDLGASTSVPTYTEQESTFDYAVFSPVYVDTVASATAGTAGQSIGYGTPYPAGGKVLSTTNDIKDRLSVYPNPTAGILNFDNQIESVQVINLDGKVLISKTGQLKSLDISSLRQGLYILRFKRKSDSNYTLKRIFKEG